MQKYLLLLMSFVCANAFGVPQPKVPGTNLTDSVSPIRPLESTPDSAGFYRLPALDAERAPGHIVLEDGSTILLLRFTKPEATTIRLHLEDIHLPEGALLFIYSLDNAGQLTRQSLPVGNQSDYWSPALPGDTAYVEVDWGNQIPGDIPFRVTQLRDTDPLEEVSEPRAVETQTGIFRGREMTWEVKDGLAVAEGDIILGRADEMDGSQAKSEGHRNGVGITGSYYRWPGGVVPYQIPADFPSPSRIIEAVNHWNSRLAGVIRLVPRTTERNYVTFLTTGGCAAMVGMTGIGAQPVYLSSSCATGNAIHELGHAIGLWHEQSREDRNRFVRVLWENVQLTSAFNFNQNIYNGDDYGAYDFNSIMHYSAYSFSWNGQPTLETIPAGIPIGQRDGLSAGDIATVRAMYGAPPVVSPPVVSPVPTPAPTPTPAPVPAPPPPPATVTVSLQTNPSGQTLRIDGATYTAPASVTWTVGTNHNVEALTPPAGATALQFVQWSDGGAQSHTVTASATTTMLKADYAVSHRVSTAALPSTGGSVAVTPDSPTDLYAANTSLGLVATPNPGYCFTSWTGLLAGTPMSTTVSVTAPLNITANFVPGTVSLPISVHFSSSAGETFSVPLSSSIGVCGWSTVSYSSWLNVVSGARGAGTGNLVIAVSPNTSGFGRSGVLIVGGRGLIVSQSAN